MQNGEQSETKAATTRTSLSFAVCQIDYFSIIGLAKLRIKVAVSQRIKSIHTVFQFGLNFQVPINRMTVNLAKYITAKNK